MSLIDKQQLDALEKEVKEQRERFSTDRMDISFGEIINMFEKKELIIRPEYQRFFRWSPQQKTALIESILLSIPIPPIFVAEDKDGVWELVDGLQRVSTILSFFGALDSSAFKSRINADNSEGVEIEMEDENESEESEIVNKWPLQAGGLIPSLEGITIDTLPSKYKFNLKRAVCRVEILRGESNISMKYELFKRLNSGGSKLTPQEIRNAVYREFNPELNNLVVELSQNATFKELTRLSPSKKREMYDQELVLRFIAFLNKTHDINKNTENYLNSFMEKAVKEKDFKADDYRNTFNKVMSLLAELEGKTTGESKIFKNVTNGFVPAYFEGITIGLAQNFSQYENNKELLKERIQKLKTDNEFRRFSGMSSNSKSRIKNRLKRANEIFAAQ